MSSKKRQLPEKTSEKSGGNQNNEQEQNHNSEMLQSAPEVLIGGQAVPKMKKQVELPAQSNSPKKESAVEDKVAVPEPSVE